MVPTDVHVKECVEMLMRRPDLSKFQNNAHQLKNIENAYSSQIYGGSIFLPIGSATKKSARRDKENSLEKDIKAINIDYLYGGGYYVLKNVQVNGETHDENPNQGQEYMDIYILVESIDQLEEMKKLKILNQSHVQDKKGQ